MQNKNTDRSYAHIYAVLLLTALGLSAALAGKWLNFTPAPALHIAAFFGALLCYLLFPPAPTAPEMVYSASLAQVKKAS